MASYTSIYDIVAGVENATQLRTNSKQDSGTDTLAGVDWFTYGGTVCSNIYANGNSWIGLGGQQEDLKVNMRDTAMWNLWREEGTIGVVRFLRIRWSGYTEYDSTSTSKLLTYDVILFDTGDIQLYIVDIPTRYYNGVFTLGNLAYTPPTVDNRWVAFRKIDSGYEVAYEPLSFYICKYLVRNEGVLYTVVDGALSELAGTLNAELFQTSGIDTVPDGALLMTLATPEVLCWTNADTVPKLTATVTATPFPQTIITDKIYLTDDSIAGIESVLATCEGKLIVAVSFDDKQTWKAWNGEQWATLSDDNTGMSKETLEAITFDQWNELYTGATGFYIRVSLLDTTQSVEKIVFDFSN